MWLETSNQMLVNLDHYSQIVIDAVIGGTAVRAHHAMHAHTATTLASFTGEGADRKAEAYFHELRLLMSRGRRLIHYKEFSPLV